MRDHGLSLSLILLLATGACQHGPTTSPEPGPAHEVHDGLAMLEGDIRPESPHPKVDDAGMYDEEDGCASIVGQGAVIVRP